jgi:polar amino acid transport system substrate-binding protein
MPVRIFLFVLISLFLSVQLKAEQLIELSAGADPWPPYIDESLPMGGVSVQIADAAFRTQGYTVKNQILPWARAIEETKQARVDLILDAWWSQERSEEFVFSRPYINGPVKFIKRKGDDFQFKDLTSLSGKSLALVRNYAYNDELLRARNYTKYEINHFMQGVQMLTMKRVDLIIENELVAQTRISQEMPELLSKIAFAEDPISDNYVFLIASYKHPKHQEIIAAFNKGLTEIINNGKYYQILKANNLKTPKMFQHKKPSS